jgi:hypothetical protein
VEVQVIRSIKSNLSTVAAAAAVVGLLAAAPATAAIVRYARNADKVDGKHAVAATRSGNRRAGKLVATNSDGYLPNNILRSARDARRLNGFLANELVRASFGGRIGDVGDFDYESFTPIHAISSRAPVDGILLVWANYTLERDAQSPSDSVAGIASRVSVDGRATGTQMAEITSAGRTSARTIALSTALPIPAGSHEVTLQAKRSYGRARAYMRSIRLQTLFVPFGNSGVQSGT